MDSGVPALTYLTLNEAQPIYGVSRALSSRVCTGIKVAPSVGSRKLIYDRFLFTGPSFVITVVLKDLSMRSDCLSTQPSLTHKYSCRLCQFDQSKCYITRRREQPSVRP